MERKDDLMCTRDGLVGEKYAVATTAENKEQKHKYGK